MTTTPKRPQSHGRPGAGILNTTARQMGNFIAARGRVLKLTQNALAKSADMPQCRWHGPGGEMSAKSARRSSC